MEARGKDLRSEAQILEFVEEKLPFHITGTYGGNTPCVEIECGAENESVLCDGGSGLREFGIDFFKQPHAKTAHVFHVFMSHLHFDHSGGNKQVANAQLIVQQREWSAGNDPDLIQANGFAAEDYHLGHDLKLIDGEHDLFGDGSVVCVPTFGHTPGHQSLKLRLASGEVLLAGDACYLRKTLENLHLPRILHNRDEMIESLKRLRSLQAAGARIFFGHDAEFWESVPQAPAEVI